MPRRPSSLQPHASSLLRLSAAALAAAAALVAPAVAQDARRDPGVGYLYPAGAQRGTTVLVSAGGQRLDGVSAARVSGEGVRAKVLRLIRPLNNRQQQELRLRLQEARAERRDRRGGGRRNGGDARNGGAPAVPAEERIALPDYPDFRDLARRTEAELQEIAARFLDGGRKQRNAQLADEVQMEVTVDPGAEPGARELRLVTPAGLSNPLRFDVGTLAETLEPSDARARDAGAAPIAAPVVVNGQVLPGDADRFVLRTKRGQRLVARATARDLVPFLADAVPGWFQATLSLRDASGREVAWCDDTACDPDPEVAYDVPADGDYVLEVRDALWRGREDFVYRVEVTAHGGARTAERAATQQPAAVPFAEDHVPRATDFFPRRDETEPNDAPRDAQPLPSPCVALGSIGRPGDADWYLIEGRAGEDVVAEVVARRLGAPTDALLRLYDPAGNVVAWNDDFEDGEPGTVTHHADSYLRATFAADGLHRLRVTDAQGHGGADFVYHLRAGPPAPDFEVAVTPSSLNVPAGRAAPFTVHVVRKDGFDGDVALSLAGAPEGFALAGAVVPRGRSSIRMTLTAPRGTSSPSAAAAGGTPAAIGPGAAPADTSVALRLEGAARIRGFLVTRPAVPAEDRMQAFAYRHLAPAQELVVQVTDARGRWPDVAVATPLPVRLPRGGTADVVVRLPGLRGEPAFSLELDAPPPGVAITRQSPVRGGLSFTLSADATATPAGLRDNLIVSVVADAAPSGGANAVRRAARRRVVSHLPAIPLEIAGK